MLKKIIKLETGENMKETFYVYEAEDKSVISLLSLFRISKKTWFKLNEEEKMLVDAELKKLNSEMRDRNLPDEYVEIIERGHASEILYQLAQEKLDSNLTGEAFSSCVKAIALMPIGYRQWLLLAEAYVRHYEKIPKSKKYCMLFVEKAKIQYKHAKEVTKGGPDILKAFGLDGDKLWEDAVNRTIDIIKLKGA